MNELRKIFVLLVLYLLLVFSVGEIFSDYGMVFQFPSHFYFLIVAVVFTNLFVPRLSWMSVTTLLGFWAMIFFIVAYFYTRVNGLEYIQILGVEFILIEVAVWMSYQLNMQLRATESLMESLAYSTYTNRTVNLRQATERIEVEMMRSRRHHRPLSLILFRTEEISSKEKKESYELMRDDLLKHFVNARIGQIMTNELRQTDLILRDPNGYFVIMCAETTKESSILLAKRIQAAISSNMGTSAQWSIASFPEEALTFDELLNQAKANLKPNQNHQVANVKSYQDVETH
ncbi:MAG: hypothetical protein Fur0016_00030 [Anaerolineales bacterium]